MCVDRLGPCATAATLSFTKNPLIGSARLGNCAALRILGSLRRRVRRTADLGPPPVVVLNDAVADDKQDLRDQLIRILQNAHAGELAAAYAYQGHFRSLRRAEERDELRRIETSEWLHRAHVAVMLAELGAHARWRREVLMGSIGRFFGSLCFVSGWFAPMYMAGRLEAMNVSEYQNAREVARQLGLSSFVDQLEAMRIEEDRHERWFGDQVRGHWLLPPARVVLGWNPPAPSVVAPESTSPSVLG